MLNFLRNLFRKRPPKPEFTDEEYDRHYEAKQAALERILGPMHEMVGHAIIPFQVGGAVDMYYFPNGIPGTGFATMELIEPDGSGPKPNPIGTSELVAFTKLPIPDDHGSAGEDHPFNRIERRMCGILTGIGRYSFHAVLKPHDTCEVPLDREGSDMACLIFDQYTGAGGDFVIDGKQHCLLLCMEVFRSELEYARANRTASLIEKLRAGGHYPYSDLEREPVA
ncbi:MAG: suppressor of fused domain protein [Candidatus Hydrogenedentes bacterium]|nr:suppressor of fused domain protein [Candidatus Hydrogenedentota bacterium]